jgi:hypothetical protein
MNVRAIKYGRIKRQAPDRIIVKFSDVALFLDRANKPKPRTS